MAVLASRDRAGLVVSTADAAPALELLRDPSLIHRYGEFHFHVGERGTPGFGKEKKGSFEEAFIASLEAFRPMTGLVGVDRGNDDLLWRLCRDILGERSIVDVSRALSFSRATKIPAEVARLRAAAGLVECGFHSIKENARAGMTEIDLAAILTRAIVEGGGVPRFASVTSGPRSALADAYSTRRAIAKGETIRIDAGFTVDGYWSDLARTFVFGEPDKRQANTYRALLSGLNEQIVAVRSGIPAKLLFEAAVASVRSNGLPQYERHHCGHGIGLRSYDSPTISATDTTVLRAGMCLYLETPFYSLGLDGMMVEDEILVTTDGHSPISTFPRDLIILA